jgi:signal transduction histidine kinase
MITADPKQRAFLDKTRQATERIRRQFQFAKDYQNIGMDSPRWQKIGALVRLAEEEAGIRSIRMDAASENAEIFADPMIGRVFYNLFDNASRHGERVTEIHVSILVSGGTPVIVIGDNGIGIPAEEKERIFERGYGKNNEWGLFLAREILAITGSSIVENGAAGSGARFEIRIPASSFRAAGREA